MSTNPNPATNLRTKRSAKDLKGNQRSAALSQLHRAAEAAAPPNYPPESMFSPSALWEWIRNYLAYVFHKKHDFPPFTASPKQAVYDLLDENNGTHNVKVSIAGDWGTGTGEAESVANCMKQFRPHFTIHLGDVYYVGDPQSVNENCLGIKNPSNNYDPVTWLIGSKGSFALNGNHEMYANGGGYFDVLLPELGLCDASGTMSGQQTSFFCLQNQYWRIIAIDTGYNSIGVPIFSHIPIINDIPGIGGNCKLRNELIDWVTDVVSRLRTNVVSLSSLTIRTTLPSRTSTRSPRNNFGTPVSGGPYSGFGGTNIVWQVTTYTGLVILRVLDGA